MNTCFHGNSAHSNTELYHGNSNTAIPYVETGEASFWGKRLNLNGACMEELDVFKINDHDHSHGHGDN